MEHASLWIKPESESNWEQHELSKAKFMSLTDDDLDDLNVSEDYSGKDFSAARFQGRDWRVLVFKYDNQEADLGLYAKNCAVRVAHQRGSDT